MLRFANFDKKERKTFVMANDQNNQFGIYRYYLDQI